MQTLTNFIQSWLNESQKPLVELYEYLRMYKRAFAFDILSYLNIDYYCQVLRLQILYEQVNINRLNSSRNHDLLFSRHIEYEIKVLNKKICSSLVIFPVKVSISNIGKTIVQ